MASIAYIIPNGLNKKIDREKESRLSYEPKQVDNMMICIEHKEAAQPLEKMLSSMVSLNEEYDEEEYDEEEYDEEYDEEEYDEFFYNSEDEEYDDKEYLSIAYSFELKLLDGALAPPPPPFNMHPPPQQQQQQQPHPVLTPFTTTDGYIDHYLVAARAVHELSALALDNDGFFWTNHGTLNQQHYQQTFPRPTPPTSSSWTRSSRASAVVNMDHTQLVDWLTADYKWAKLFPSIVSKATFLRFLVKGSSSRNPDGSVQLIHATLQATTMLLPKRTFAFLRTCKQINHSTWVVADIQIDRLRNVGFPCGCLIRGIADGFSEVIWVEHLQVEENYLDPNLYTDLTCRGFAYGAQRWVACLERSCERRSYRTKTDILVPCLLGQEDEDPWQVEKKCVMKLSQRMVTHFCSNISFHTMKQQLLSSVPGLRNLVARTVLRQSPYHDDPKEMVLISAATFTLPHSPDFVFGILADEHTRHEWDTSGKISQFTEPTCYTTGNDPRNKIYVYQTHRWTDNEVILQEASVNRSGSLLVWSVIKRNEFELVRGGRGPRLPLVRLSGLAISSNCHQNATSSGNTGGSSIVTLGAQQEAHDIKELEPKMLAFVHKCIRATVDRIEAVLNKAAARTIS